jgi:hypothetical protein
MTPPSSSDSRPVPLRNGTPPSVAAGSATAAAVPPLAAQLAAPNTFDNACFLLESLRLPAADAALVEALDKTSGREQAGLFDALARRAVPGAEKKALAQISAPEPVHTAALHYLGTLATPGALDALAARPDDAAAADASLLAAERLSSRRDTEAAVAVYTRLSTVHRCPIVSGSPPLQASSRTIPTV